MKKITIFLFVIFTIFSCKKNENKNTQEETKKSYLDFSSYVTSGNSQQYDGYITYSASTVASKTTGSRFYDASAYFYKSLPITTYDRHENVGDVLIGGLTIPANTGPAYGFNFSQNQDVINQTQFGSNVNFAITGNGSNYAAANVDFYVPEELWLDSVNICKTDQRLNDPLILNWNADPNNSEVAIIVSYNGPLSNFNDNSLSNKSYALNAIITPDNGTYTIPAGLFAQFPVGSVIEIYVGRSSSGIMNSASKTIGVLAYAYSRNTRVIIP